MQRIRNLLHKVQKLSHFKLVLDNSSEELNVYSSFPSTIVFHVQSWITVTMEISLSYFLMDIYFTVWTKLLLHSDSVNIYIIFFSLHTISHVLSAFTYEKKCYPFTSIVIIYSVGMVEFILDQSFQCFNIWQWLTFVPAKNCLRKG